MRKYWKKLEVVVAALVVGSERVYMFGCYGKDPREQGLKDIANWVLKPKGTVEQVEAWFEARRARGARGEEVEVKEEEVKEVEVNKVPKKKVKKVKKVKGKKEKKVEEVNTPEVKVEDMKEEEGIVEETVVEEVDQDGSGTVDFGEFLAMMTG